MKIAIQPFFSQQNKITDKFLTEGCLTVRISAFIANKLEEEGHDVVTFLPDAEQCTPSSPLFYTQIATRHMPPSNKLQRLDFNAAWFEQHLRGVDLLITCNELLPAKVRHVFNGKIIVLNNLFPMGDWIWMKQLQEEAWRVSDGVAFMSPFIRDQMYPNGLVWPMVYDADRIQHNSTKDIDVLFVQRCSINNYTHHLEFLETLPLLQDLNVIFADPTGYLEKTHPELNYAHTFGDKYYNLLSRTKVVVAIMTGDIHGGTSVREAIVSGANPVFLRYPHYEDIVKDTSFSGFCSLEPGSIANAIRRQLETVPNEAIRQRVAQESYQNMWPAILKDIETICQS